MGRVELVERPQLAMQQKRNNLWTAGPSLPTLVVCRRPPAMFWTIDWRCFSYISTVAPEVLLWSLHRSWLSQCVARAWIRIGRAIEQE